MNTQSGPSIPDVLPRGPHRLGRDVVAASQRLRLLGAMAHAVAEKGYGAVSVADVIGRAAELGALEDVLFHIQLSLLGRPLVQGD